MNKLLLYVAILFLFSQNVAAQIIYPKDENGKITYLGVVKIDSTTKDSLFNGITKWVKRNYSKYNTVVVDSVNYTIKTPGHFLVYINPGVLKEIHGEIFYDLNIEVKENRYRYVFTNFKFEYYKQDRADYKYKPTKKFKPLEDETFPGWGVAWQKHKANTDAHVKKMIGSLYYFLTIKEAKEKELNTVIKKDDNW